MLLLAMMLVLGGMVAVSFAQQPAAPATSEPAAPAAGAAPAPPAGTPAPPAPSKIDKGDTDWMLTSSLLVLMMKGPGVALIYAGNVSQTNSLASLLLR